jgi:DNA-binding MarR family transcriptional regulator
MSDRDLLLAELGAIVRRSQRATEAVDDAAGRRLGINRTDGRCLEIIDQHTRMTAGELARESGLTTGAITGVVDRLEAHGYVRRVSDPDDRRRVVVEITELSRERALQLFGPLVRDSGPLLEHYSDEQLRLLIEFHTIAAEMTERHAERLHAESLAETLRVGQS